MFRGKLNKETNSSFSGSILEQPFVEPILAGAHDNLLREGSLAPVLFVRFQDDELGILPLDLPELTAEKYAYFGLLGMSLAAAGSPVREALFLSEIWYVAASAGSKGEEEIRPSQHPERREAISVIGRDSLRSRFTFVVQVFHREAGDRLVLDAREVEEYNIGAVQGTEAVGLLDALFPRRTPVM